MMPLPQDGGGIGMSTAGLVRVGVDGPAQPPVTAPIVDGRPQRLQPHALAHPGQPGGGLFGGIAKHREHKGHGRSVAWRHDRRQEISRTGTVRRQGHNRGMTHELVGALEAGEFGPLSRRDRDRLVRQIARLFGVSPWVVGAGVDGFPMPPSRVANSAYHQRQRNRVKRRRR